MTSEEEQGPIQQPIDGVLDLHTFRPGDVKALLVDYLEECRSAGIMDVRIIHGKGTGALRDLVHAQLKKNPLVLSFQLSTDRSSWGATIVKLKL